MFTVSFQEGAFVTIMENVLSGGTRKPQKTHLMVKK